MDVISLGQRLSSRLLPLAHTLPFATEIRKPLLTLLGTAAFQVETRSSHQGYQVICVNIKTRRNMWSSRKGSDVTKGDSGVCGPSHGRSAYVGKAA